MVFEDGAGVEDTLGIESVLDSVVEFKDVFTEVFGQPGALQSADAVFPGDGAAQLDREIHHFSVGDVRALLLRLVRRVEQEQRVSVAVAGVGNDGDGDIAVLTDLFDPVDEVAEAR